MNDTTKPEALRLAELLDGDQAIILRVHAEQAGTELLRQHERIAELEAENASLREQRQPLTNLDLGVYVSKEWAEYLDGAYADASCAKDQLTHFARTIERAHEIGGGNAD